MWGLGEDGEGTFRRGYAGISPAIAPEPLMNSLLSSPLLGVVAWEGPRRWVGCVTAGSMGPEMMQRDLGYRCCDGAPFSKKGGKQSAALRVGGFPLRNELWPVVGRLDPSFLLAKERVRAWLPPAHLLAHGSRTVAGIPSSVWKSGPAGYH